MISSTNVSVIVVNYKTPHYAIECIRSLVQERVAIPGLEVVLIDNASGDGSPDIMAISLADLVEEGFVKLMPLDLNGGFGWANNQALLMLMARANPPEFVMLLNPDCTIERGAIKILHDDMTANDGCAAAGSQLVNPDGSWTGSAFRFPTIAREFVRGSGMSALDRMLNIAPIVIRSERTCEAEWVTGASCMLRTSALLEQGFFDDGFFLYFEEVELMFRLRKTGWTIRHIPNSRVVHIGGASTGLREGKALSMPSFPPYWFQSRLRFFTLAYGPIRAWLAAMAWLSGTAIGRLAAFIQPSNAKHTNLADVRQMLTYGLGSDANDIHPAIVRSGDLAGSPPQWMVTAQKGNHA